MYDRISSQRSADTLKECGNLLSPGLTLWVAMQSNGLMDVGMGYSPNWATFIDGAKKSLADSGFQNEELDTNFRNGIEIFQCSNRIKKTDSSDMEIQNVLGLPTSGTNVSSSEPKVFNFNWKNYLDGAQQNLNNAMTTAVNTMKKEMVDSEHNAYVILVDDDIYKISQISKALRNLEKEIFCYPCAEEHDVEKELDLFLTHQRGCLVTTQDLFKGAECENGIAVQHSDNVAYNMRGNLLRVVSKLVIVNGLDHTKVFETPNVVIGR